MIQTDDYVMCVRKREIVERRPNGETICKEYYVPVEEEDIDWKKAFIELVENVGYYIDHKERWKYVGNDRWSDIYDGRLRPTSFMPSVVLCTLQRGKWEGESH